MPKYDFRCEECGNEFEILVDAQKISEVKCLKCGSQKTQKLLSTPAIILKGGGFYKTDSRSKDSKKPASGCSGSNCSSCSNCG